MRNEISIRQAAGHPAIQQQPMMMMMAPPGVVMMQPGMVQQGYPAPMK